MKTEIAVVLLVVAATFGSVVPDYHPVADDIGRRANLIRVDRANDTLAGELAAAFWRGEFLGHYRPMQDVTYVLCYHFTDNESYGVPLSIVYLAMHCGTALLLIAILRRLDMRRAPALLAGVLFAVHPALDENIACIQFGNNIAGMFWVLAAAWCLLPARSRAGRIARLVGAAVSIFTAIGFGINLAVTAAMLSPVVLLLTLRERTTPGDTAWTRLRPLVLPITAGFIGAILAFWLRLDVYGTLKTHQSSYKELEPDRNPTRMAEELARTTLRLEPAKTQMYSAAQSPGGDRIAEFQRELMSVDGLVCLLLALTAAGAAILISRRDDRPARLARSTAFGVALFVAALFPYVWFLGRLGPNRYGYAGVPGMAVAAIALLVALAWLVSRIARSRSPDLITALLCIPLIFCCARTSREAARSIVAGQDVARTVVRGTVEAVRADPGVVRIYAVGFPRVVGRSGYTLTFIVQLRGYVRRLLDRVILHSTTNLYADLFEGRLPAGELGPETAVLCFREDGTLERVRSLAELEGTPGGREEAFRELRHHWGFPPWSSAKLLALIERSDPRKTSAILTILDELEGGERADQVRKALWRVFASRPRKSSPGFPGLASQEALARALELVREHGDEPAPSPVITMAATLRNGTAPLNDAVLGAIEDERDPERRAELAYACALASSDDAVVAGALGAIEGAESPAAAVAEERAAMDAAYRSSPDLEAVARHAAEATRLFAAAGIKRRTPASFAAGCELASLADAELERRAAELKRKGRGWKAGLARTILAGRERTTVTVEVAAAADAGRGDAPAAFSVFVRNTSARPLQVRGRGLADPWLHWTIADGSGEEVAAGAQPLPGPDLAPRASRPLPLYLRLPATAGRYDLRVRFMAFGRELAQDTRTIEVVR